jgi:DNA-binding NarL/FixJ family response regulator
MQHSLVIVDDHLLIAKAISGIISNFKNYNVLYEAGHGKDLIQRMSQPGNTPDIVLLDISMPVMDGFETAQWLRTHHPAISIMVLTMQNQEEALIRMIKAGAKGYLHKNVHPAELEIALDSLVARGFYYPDWATNKILTNIAGEDKRNNAGIQLSAREREFLAYAATELTYKEISEKMFCSPRTIEGYRDALFEKLNIKTRVGLVVYAIKTGIIEV